MTGPASDYADLAERVAGLERQVDFINRSLDMFGNMLGRMQGHVDEALDSMKAIREHLERDSGEGEEWREG